MLVHFKCNLFMFESLKVYGCVFSAKEVTFGFINAPLHILFDAYQRQFLATRSSLVHIIMFQAYFPFAFTFLSEACPASMVNLTLPYHIRLRYINWLLHIQMLPAAS